MRAISLGVLLVGCATATSTEHDETRDAQAGIDSSERADGAEAAIDAAAHADAASQPDAAADAVAASCATPASGVLATWSFTGAAGSQVSTSASSSTMGITASVVTRSPALTAVSGAGSINSSGWPTGAMDAARYYTLTITPAAGCQLDLTAMTIDAKASASGPTAGSVAASTDAFAHTTVVSTSAPGTIALAVTGATSPIEVRVYGFGAASATGTLRIQSMLSISGVLH